MVDYKETSISGKTWQRAHLIVISNNLGQLPTVAYQEEEIIALGTGNIQRPMGTLGYQVDMAGEIALRNPETLALTGETVPVALIHQALLSDYLNRAFERDNPPAVESETAAID